MARVMMMLSLCACSVDPPEIGVHCPSGQRRGADTVCHDICGSFSDCELGQLCTDELCLADPSYVPECRHDSDCDDDDACTGFETCVADRCVPGVPFVCEDLFACTDTVCADNNGVAGCFAGEARADALCDDGDGCTEHDHCSAQGACAGSALAFDDGDPCNGIETCVDGALSPGAAFECVATRPCVTAACVNEAGTPRCVETPTGAGGTCNDGDACTTTDQCNANGDCVAGPARICADDGNPCTIADCNSSIGCVHHPLSNVDCTGVDQCQPARCFDGVCTPSTPVDCDDDIDCTIDRCVPQSGACERTPDSNRCDGPCHVGRCLVGSGCERVTENAPFDSCNDDNSDTASSFCAGADDSRECLGVFRWQVALPPAQEPHCFRAWWSVVDIDESSDEYRLLVNYDIDIGCDIASVWTAVLVSSDQGTTFSRLGNAAGTGQVLHGEFVGGVNGNISLLGVLTADGVAWVGNAWHTNLDSTLQNIEVITSHGEGFLGISRHVWFFGKDSNGQGLGRHCNPAGVCANAFLSNDSVLVGLSAFTHQSCSGGLFGSCQTVYDDSVLFANQDTSVPSFHGARAVLDDPTGTSLYYLSVQADDFKLSTTAVEQVVSRTGTESLALGADNRSGATSGLLLRCSYGTSVACAAHPGVLPRATFLDHVVALRDVYVLARLTTPAKHVVLFLENGANATVAANWKQIDVHTGAGGPTAITRDGQTIVLSGLLAGTLTFWSFDRL